MLTRWSALSALAAFSLLSSCATTNSNTKAVGPRNSVARGTLPAPHDYAELSGQLLGCSRVLATAKNRTPVIAYLDSHPRRQGSVRVLLEMVGWRYYRPWYNYALIDDGLAIRGLLEGKISRHTMERQHEYFEAIRALVARRDPVQLHLNDRVMEADCAFVTIETDDRTVRVGMYPAPHLKYQAEEVGVPWQGPETTLLQILFSVRGGMYLKETP